MKKAVSNFIQTQKDFRSDLLQALSIKNYSHRLKSTKLIIKEAQNQIHIYNNQNTDGLSVVFKLSEMADAIIETIWDQIVYHSNHNDKMIAIVAIGSYGRMELCPQSDIDLLFLTSDQCSESEQQQIETIVQHLWDLGFEVGSSTRTVKQCLEVLKNDFNSWTSFSGERFLTGNYKLYQNFFEALKKPLSSKKTQELIQYKVEERKNRIDKFGGLLQLLEPNIKECSGGLRDAHIVFWIAYFQYQCRSFSDLVRHGFMLPRDLKDLLHAYYFLLKVRCSLHFISKSKNNILLFDLQAKIAKDLGFPNLNNKKPVEIFLREFYLSGRTIHRITEAFIARWQANDVESVFDTKQFPSFVCQNGVLELINQSGNEFSENVNLMLNYFDLVNQKGYGFSNRVYYQISLAISKIEVGTFNPQPHLKKFFSLCMRTKRVGRMLISMRDVGLFSLLFPDFANIDCHVQHNMYHIFTTDEHTLAVLKQLAYLPHTKMSYLVEAYHRIKDKEVLILACLFHDIGKGVLGNHSETGAVMIKAYMLKNRFTNEQTEEASLLVYHHLLMNEIAQRRNIDDHSVIDQFTNIITSPQTLHKLYVLTYCDTSSTHPDAWTKWKEALLKKLYQKSLDILMQKDSSKLNLSKKKKEFSNALNNNDSNGLLSDYLNNFPKPYLESLNLETLKSDLAMKKQLNQESQKNVVLNIQKLDNQISIRVMAIDSVDFLAATFAAFLELKISVVQAQVYTGKDGLILDKFDVILNEFLLLEDLDKLKEKLLFKIKKNIQIGSKKITQHLTQNNFIRRLNSTDLKESHIPLGIKILNTSHSHCTTIDITCYSYNGLVYDILSLLKKYEINIYGAKLTSEAGIAIDSFFVQSLEFMQIQDLKIIDSIKSELAELLP